MPYSWLARRYFVAMVVGTRQISVVSIIVIVIIVIVMVIITIGMVIAIVIIVSAVPLGRGDRGRAAAVLQPEGVGGACARLSPSSSWSERC